MNHDGVAATQRFYTRWAGVYDAVASRTPGVGRLRERAVGALALERGDVVVDVGCGTGANFPHLRDRVGPEGTVVGVDFTRGMLVQARDRIERAGWRNVHVVRGDATRPPVGEADAVFASFLSGMLPDPAAAVRTWAALAGPDGRLGLLDLARSDRAGALNALFRLLVVASSPPGARRGSPTRTLDRRVGAAHRTLRDVCEADVGSRHALGFARVSAGRVPPDRES